MLVGNESLSHQLRVAVCLEVMKSNSLTEIHQKLPIMSKDKA
jgi:hypothetical protein